MPVITTFGGMSARGFGLFAGGSLLPATSFITITATTSTNVVPLGYNAIHIQAAVGGGGGGNIGCDYDKAGGESSGAGGGSGAYISDKIFSVIAGETITLNAGTSGATQYNKLNGTAGSGTTTSLSGSTTGSIFSLTGGGGGAGVGGGGQGPLRTNIAGAAGISTISGTSITSGKYNLSGVVISVTTNTSGPVGVFNQSGNGAAGNNNGNCGGDNCQIAGSTGAPSYSGNIAGGAGSPQGQNVNGTAGTRGSGGGGGGAQYGNQGFGACTLGAAGGNGEIIFRFLQVKQ